MIGKITNRLKHKFEIIRNKGNAFECPFCGYQAKKLSPIGFDFPVLNQLDVIGGGRRDGGCFQCGSIDRERLVFTYLKNIFQIDLKTDLTILHVAPEKHLSEALAKMKFKNYICGDFFTEGYSYPAHVVNVNLLDIPFPENNFDLLICNHVLEHIEDDTRAMREIYRVLKNGGFAILQVPISAINEHTIEDFSIRDPKQREINYGQFDHVRIYGHDYLKRLQSVGFEVEKINISSQFPKAGLNQKEYLFICKKNK